jgi:Protein of unknown function (DUF3307)
VVGIVIGNRIENGYGDGMFDTVSLVVLLIAALQLKHIICDGPLQTLAMVRAKSRYGAPLGLLHAAIHGLGTAVMLAFFGVAFPVLAGLALLDAVIHYHVDFTKENIVKINDWTPQDGPFWWSFTADQALHHMTYVLLAWLVLKP